MGQEEDLIHKHNIMTITYYDKVYTCTTWAITSIDDVANVWDVLTNRFEWGMMIVWLIIVIALILMRTSMMDK